MRALATGALLLLFAASCRRERPRPDRTEPWLASASTTPSSSAAPVAARRLGYTLAESRIEFELPARRENPRGRFRIARGELDVDLGDPERSTGRLEIELDSLELSTKAGAAETDPDAGFDERALAWLELGRAVPAERRESGRIATYTLRQLSGASERELNPDERGLRTGDFSVRGDLALHGVRAPVSALVSVLVTSAEDGTAPPAKLVIRSRRPLVVSLSTHDIRPRDSRGFPLPREQALLGDSVGREAKIEFELVFVPHS